jgi:hypothetical protein
VLISNKAFFPPFLGVAFFGSGLVAGFVAGFFAGFLVAIFFNVNSLLLL